MMDRDWLTIAGWACFIVMVILLGLGIYRGATG